MIRLEMDTTTTGVKGAKKEERLTLDIKGLCQNKIKNFEKVIT
jgi:hypothetical protein